MKHLENTKYKILLFLFIILFIFVFLDYVLARAGGGQSYRASGGYSSTSYGSGGGGASIDIILLRYLIILAIENPTIGIPTIIIVIGFAGFGYWQTKEYYTQYTITKGFRIKREYDVNKGLSELRVRDAKFDKQAFLERVKNAFVKIQKAWSEKKLESVQHFLSDGVYDRFNIMLKILSEQNLRNKLDNINVLDCDVRYVHNDEYYNVISISITASIVDTIVEEKTGKIVEGSTLPDVFEEIWTFIRRPGAKTLSRPGLLEGYCPNCGTPIEAARIVTCKSCNAILRSGEYDWVLSEIVQACEWYPYEITDIPGYKSYKKVDPAFNPYIIHDRVSVIFWRHYYAKLKEKEDALLKFSTQNFIDYFKENINITKGYYIKNCAIGKVTIKAIVASEPYDKIFVEVGWGGKFGLMKNLDKNTQRSLSEEYKNFKSVYVLVRKNGVQTDIKNGLDTTKCPNCGATETSIFDFVCPYCQTYTNDISKDWMLDKIVPLSSKEMSDAIRFARRLDGHFVEEPETKSINLQTLNEEYKTERLKNIKINLSPVDIVEWLAKIMLADGVIDNKEWEFLLYEGKKLGVSEARINAIIASLRMSQNYGYDDSVPTFDSFIESQNFLRLLIRMALADGQLSDDERRVIINCGKKFGYAPIDINVLINNERKIMFAEAKNIIRNYRALS